MANGTAWLGSHGPLKGQKGQRENDEVKTGARVLFSLFERIRGVFATMRYLN